MPMENPDNLPVPTNESKPGGTSGNRRSDRSNRAGGRDRSGGRKTQTKIPSRRQIMEQLVKLSGAVTLGLISPSKANVIQRNLRMLLDEHNRAQQGGDEAASETILDLCREDPQLLNYLSPFLTDEQVEQVTGEIMDDDGGDG